MNGKYIFFKKQQSNQDLNNQLQTPLIDERPSPRYRTNGTYSRTPRLGDSGKS